MKKIMLMVLIAAFLESCAPIIVSRVPFPVPGPENGKKGEALSLHALEIPSGHMPPPGSSRIWYLGRTPRHQPPPFMCGIGRLNIPLGAFLVQRLEGKFVQVDENDAIRPNFVMRTGTFQLKN